jgi:hypothetical protein
MILSTERANGEIMFQITYEQAMNIEPKLINEKELIRLNFLRETSLLSFYRTGVKSLYSYVCHNVTNLLSSMSGLGNLCRIEIILLLNLRTNVWCK